MRYYLTVAPGALAGIRDRPIVLKRFVNGAEGEAFYQKRAPTDAAAWLRTVTLSFPSGRTAEEIVVDDAAGLAWIVNLGCIELHPHPVRSGNLDHPDELRIDLDPVPGVAWSDVRRVALEVQGFLEEVGLRGWPKTSGSRGMHVNVRIEPRWTFTDVRRAAVALSRAVERRVPTLASSKWWKEERHGVFLDYNQNAKDRTTCSAYSVRPLPDARVSAPLHWNEVPIAIQPTSRCSRCRSASRKIGDPHADMDADCLARSTSCWNSRKRTKPTGLGDAPWPPHFRKMEGGSASSGAVAREGRGGKEACGVERCRSSSLRTLPIKQRRLAGLERWKKQAFRDSRNACRRRRASRSMRGRSSTWTRIRVNLRHVPEALRPPQETPDPDDDPTRELRQRWQNKPKKQ